jgi:hypothetical protein
MGNRRQEATAAWLLGCALELRSELPRAIEAMERTQAYHPETGHPDHAQTWRTHRGVARADPSGDPRRP